MSRAFVRTTRCPLMERPTHACEQIDELLLGWPVEILSPAAPGWAKVRTDYGYEGFAPLDCLCTDPDRVNLFAAAPKAVVTKGFCTVLSEPKVQRYLVAELVRGALVAPLTAAGENGWVKVALPGGGGFTKESFLGAHHTAPVLRGDALRRAITGSALSYLGAHYRWGGKSPLGLDCSGLAFMAYWLNGVTLCRDARPEPPLHTIPRADMAQGDLLFFPGHVAVYLGDGRYVHSTGRNGSDGVVVNSLDPGDPTYREDLDHSLTAVGSIF